MSEYSFLTLHQHMLFSAIYCGLIPNWMQISLNLIELETIHCMSFSDRWVWKCLDHAHDQKLTSACRRDMPNNIVYLHVIFDGYILMCAVDFSSAFAAIWVKLQNSQMCQSLHTHCEEQSVFCHKLTQAWKCGRNPCFKFGENRSTKGLVHGTRKLSGKHV